MLTYRRPTKLRTPEPSGPPDSGGPLSSQEGERVQMLEVWVAIKAVTLNSCAALAKKTLTSRYVPCE